MWFFTRYLFNQARFLILFLTFAWKLAPFFSPLCLWKRAMLNFEMILNVKSTNLIFLAKFGLNRLIFWSYCDFFYCYMEETAAILFLTQKCTFAGLKFDTPSWLMFKVYNCTFSCKNIRCEFSPYILFNTVYSFNFVLTQLALKINPKFVFPYFLSKMAAVLNFAIIKKLNVPS